MSEIHREHPDATPAEIEALQLAAIMKSPPAGGPMTEEERKIIQARQAEPQVEVLCRDCGDPFNVPESKASSGSKWWNLCGWCIRHEC